MSKSVRVSSQGIAGPGTCWECGCANAPLRLFRLSQVELIPTGISVFLVGESITVPIPLCANHSALLHGVSRWMRILSLPIALLIFILALGIPDHFPEIPYERLRWVEFAGVASSFVIFTTLRIWANRMQNFRLVTLLPKVIVVEFKDEGLAEKIQRDTDVMVPAIHLNSAPAQNK